MGAPRCEDSDRGENFSSSLSYGAISGTYAHLPSAVGRATVAGSTTKGSHEMSSATPSTPQRHDPIREKYFKPVELAELWSTILFYVAALLSFAVLAVNQTAHPVLFDVAQIAFVVAAVLLFALDLANRIYLTPSALDARRTDLLSNAYRVSLTHEQTTGYYNNDENDPLRRLGVAVMENSHFSRAIARAMAKTERAKVGIYGTLLIVLWLHRSTDLAIAATAAQVVFSEHILSQWLRLEWFRIRCDTTYKHLYGLFQRAPVRATLQVQALEWFAFYEAAKSNSGVTLSSAAFKRLNESLSLEWEQIKLSLKL